MTITVAEVMREVRNCFPQWRYEGPITLTGGRLTPEGLLLPGDWLALSGSAHSDGIHQLDAAGLLVGAPDESFDGRLWLLKPPEDFLRLCGEIAEFAGGGGAGVRREAFGEYSVEWAGSAGGGDWRSVYAPLLKPYRRMVSEVPLC